MNTRCPLWDLMTPERQAAWDAELARSPTPPPTTDEVVDTLLALSRATTPVYRLEIQPLMPPLVGLSVVLLLLPIATSPPMVRLLGGPNNLW